MSPGARCRGGHGQHASVSGRHRGAGGHARINDLTIPLPPRPMASSPPRPSVARCLFRTCNLQSEEPLRAGEPRGSLGGEGWRRMTDPCRLTQRWSVRSMGCRETILSGRLAWQGQATENGFCLYQPTLHFRHRAAESLAFHPVCLCGSARKQRKSLPVKGESNG